MLWTKCEETLFDKLFDIWFHCLIIVAELFLFIVFLLLPLAYIYSPFELGAVGKLFFVFTAIGCIFLEISVITCVVFTVIKTYKKIKEIVQILKNKSLQREEYGEK